MFGFKAPCVLYPIIYHNLVLFSEKQGLCVIRLISIGSPKIKVLSLTWPGFAWMNRAAVSALVALLQTFIVRVLTQLLNKWRKKKPNSCNFFPPKTVNCSFQPIKLILQL